MLTRRHFLTVSAAAAVAAGPAARAAAPLSQVAGIYRRDFGDLVVTALLDGYLPLDPTLLIGAEAGTVERLLREAFIGAPPVEASINAYVIHAPGERTILVDGGLSAAAAEAFGAKAADLGALLAKAGVTPEEVDTIFATHLHVDHVGLFTRDGEAMFPNAELALHEAERAFWTDDANFAGADESVMGFVQAARAALAPYADRLRPLEDGAEVAPGVSLVHLPGHTPGHSGLRLASGDAQGLLWGDIVHVAPVQFPEPDVSIAFDVDPAQAAATRKRAMEMAAADRLEIAGSHIVFPSFGHVARAAADGYRFVPGGWDYDL